MSKKPKKIATPAPTEDQNAVRVPDGATKATKLKKLLSDARSSSADVASINGTMREKIADACENHGLHKKAFSMIRSLDKLTPEKLADLMDHFDYYFEASGLASRAASAQRLPMGDGAVSEAEGDGEEEDDGSGNIARFPAAASPQQTH